jgi:hypothetical protein
MVRFLIDKSAIDSNSSTVGTRPDSGSADSDTTDSTHTNIHHKNNKYRWGGKTALSRDYANRRKTI